MSATKKKLSKEAKAVIKAVREENERRAKLSCLASDIARDILILIRERVKDLPKEEQWLLSSRAINAVAAVLYNPVYRERKLEPAHANS